MGGFSGLRVQARRDARPAVGVDPCAMRSCVRNARRGGDDPRVAVLEGAANIPRLRQAARSTANARSVL